MAIHTFSVAMGFTMTPKPDFEPDNLVKNYRWFSANAMLIMPFNEDVRIIRVATFPRFQPIGDPYIPNNSMDRLNMKRIGNWQYLINFGIFSVTNSAMINAGCTFIGGGGFCSFANYLTNYFFTTTAKPYFEPACLYANRFQIREFQIYSSDFINIAAEPWGPLLLTVDFTFEVETK